MAAKRWRVDVAWQRADGTTGAATVEIEAETQKAAQLAAFDQVAEPGCGGSAQATLIDDA